MEDARINDSDELERLQTENERLRQSLEQERKEHSIVKKLLLSNIGWKNQEELNENMRRVFERCDRLQQDIEDISRASIRLVGEKEALEEENSRLKGQLQSAVRDCEEKLFILTKGQGWERFIAGEIRQRYRVTAEILCCAVKGCTAEETVGTLAESGGIHITARRVSNALSVKNDKDLLRISAVFHQFSDMFREYGVSEKDILEWFSETRMKEFKFIDKKELEKCFG